MKIAIFCPNWVGDTVMATPALRAVRTQFARAEIVAVMRPYVADVLRGLDLFDRRLIELPWHGHNARHRTAETASGLGLLARLRREQFDLALLLPNSFRSALLAFLSGAKRRVGFDRDARGWLLTQRVRPRPRHQPFPVLDEYLRLAQALGCRRLTRRTELATQPEDEARLAAFWKRQSPGEAGARGVICVNPGGAYGASKHWPTRSFAELCRRLAVTLGRRVLVLCGPSERDEARSIARLANHRAVVSLADEFPTIGLVKSAVRHAELLVTTDSGPRHFARPFRVPVVTLFGATHPGWSETHDQRSLHLALEVDCGPCQERTCPLGHHRCMRGLSVDWVFRACAAQLRQYDSLSRAA